MSRRKDESYSYSYAAVTHQHHQSHSKHKRQRSSDVKAYRKTRYFFAFILYLSISVLAFGITAKAVPLSAQHVAGVFSNAEYSQSLYEDVSTYASDMCIRNNVPASALDGVLDYGTVKEINRAYVYGTLSLDEKYTPTVYQTMLEELTSSLEKSIDSAVKASGVGIADGQGDGAERLAKDITDYFGKRMVFPYMEKVQTVVNLGSTAAYIAIAVSAVISVALVLIVIALGSELYRNLRSVAHALSASTMLCWLTAATYRVINSAKDLFFFPTYLNDSIISYLNDSAKALTVTGALLAAATLTVLCFVWKLKSDAMDD